MIQANLLLSLEGKTPESFTVADVLRFPLGVLTGVGFIGGGTILKRGNLVLGVTTAATLWLVTAIGLCFGGGQWAVGAAGTFLVVFTRWALKWLDMRIPREHRALLAIDAPGNWAPVPNELDRILRPKGYRAVRRSWSTARRCPQVEVRNLVETSGLGGISSCPCRRGRR